MCTCVRVPVALCLDDLLMRGVHGSVLEHARHRARLPDDRDPRPSQGTALTAVPSAGSRRPHRGLGSHPQGGRRAPKGQPRASLPGKHGSALTLASTPTVYTAAAPPSPPQAASPRALPLINDAWKSLLLVALATGPQAPALGQPAFRSDTLKGPVGVSRARRRAVRTGEAEVAPWGPQDLGGRSTCGRSLSSKAAGA